MTSKILIYLPLANRHRCPIMNQLARRHAAMGDEVSIIVENRVAVYLNGQFVGNSRHERTIPRYLNPGDFRDFFALCWSKTHLREWAGREDERIRRYEEILRRYPFDKILIWNGNFEYQRGFISTVRKLGLESALSYVEVGWLDQSNSVYVDPTGINAASTLATKAPPPITRQQADELADFLTAYRAPHVAGKDKTDIAGHDTPTVLVPLQVDTDSNILLHSPFDSMADFISYLEGWIPPGYRVILRPHPKAKYGYAIQSCRSDFEVRTEGDIKAAVLSADLVIGINTTVLIQALALGKPTVAFGKGVFSASKAVLPMQLGEPFTRPQWDEDAVEQLLYHLVFRRQIWIEPEHTQRQPWPNYLATRMRLKLSG